jgi:hypothetical protein
MSPRSARIPGLVTCAAILLVAGLFLASSASAADWLPLKIGNEWTYVDDGDEPHVETFIETGFVRGRRVFVRQYVGGPDDGLYNFWLKDAEGGVLLAGYYKPAYPFGLVYEPPVKIVPGVPTVGMEYSTHVYAWSVPDNAPYAEFDVYMSVQQNVSLSMLAGTFTCFGVGQVAPPAPSFSAAPGVTLGLDGRVIGDGASRLGTGPDSPGEWYADGVGLVQYYTDVLFQLSTANLPTPTAQSSWGRLKQLYR